MEKRKFLKFILLTFFLKKVKFYLYSKTSWNSSTGIQTEPNPDPQPAPEQMLIFCKEPVLRIRFRIRVRDPVLFWTLDPIRCYFDPWIRDPGWGKNLDPDQGSGKNIPDHISENLEQFLGLKILKFFDADPDRNRDPGSVRSRIWDPGWKNLDPGSGINIPDPQHWRSTHDTYYILYNISREDTAPSTLLPLPRIRYLWRKIASYFFLTSYVRLFHRLMQYIS